jgi:hypothetical protein
MHGETVRPIPTCISMRPITFAWFYLYLTPEMEKQTVWMAALEKPWINLVRMQIMTNKGLIFTKYVPTTNPNIARLIATSPNWMKFLLLYYFRYFPIIGEHIITATEYILNIGPIYFWSIFAFSSSIGKNGAIRAYAQLESRVTAHKQRRVLSILSGVSKSLLVESGVLVNEPREFGNYISPSSLKTSSKLRALSFVLPIMNNN